MMQSIDGDLIYIFWTKPFALKNKRDIFDFGFITDALASLINNNYLKNGDLRSPELQNQYTNPDNLYHSQLTFEDVRAKVTDFHREKQFLKMFLDNTKKIRNEFHRCKSITNLKDLKRSKCKPEHYMEMIMMGL